MSTNHLVALMKTFLLTFIVSILFVLLATILYFNLVSMNGIEMVVSFLACFITSIMMCALWLPAVTIIDKQKLNEMDAISLFTRHLPFVMIPFVLIFVLMYVFESTPTEMSVIIIEIMFTAFASLYIYFRILKSKGFDREAPLPPKGE